jgi:hypothetical protein
MKPIDYKILLVAAILSLGCTTKVSEWVLLNTVPDQYTLIYFHHSPASAVSRDQNASIAGKMRHANIEFKTVETREAAEPYYGLYYRGRLFKRYNDYRELTGLASSPLREKIAAELMAGKLCVLLYLTGTDTSVNRKGREIIKKATAASPFRDIISTCELNRKNSEEAHFVSMLLNVEEDLNTIAEPMLFGVFARFKALEPLVGKGITEENIDLMISFLTADCSCLIKDDLPGTDILFNGTWDNPAPALLNAILDANPSLMHR